MKDRIPLFLWFLVVSLILAFLSDKILIVGVLTMALAGRFVIVLKLERLLLLGLYAFLPFTIDLEILPGIKMNLPAEGLTLLLSFATLFGILEIQKQNWQHFFIYPKQNILIYAALFFLLVLACATPNSTMNIVSFKFLAINIAFITVGLGFTYLCLIKNRIHLRELLISITTGLTLVSIYTIGNSIVYGIGRNVAQILPKPFFNDHTHYAATTLLILPLVIYLWKTENNLKLKRLYLFSIGISSIGIFITFCRASWIGAIIMLFVYLILHFRIKIQFILLLLTPILFLFWLNFETIQSTFFTNRNDSNRSASSIEEQFKSVTNLKTDASNLERLNRWKCAIRMGNHSPFYGYGPGTYQFQYLSFQRKEDLTRISVKSPFNIKAGRGGTAHSEYLLSFAEEGYFGLISWIGIVLSVFISYFSINTFALEKSDSFLLKMILLSFIGYFIHAFMNNFLNVVNFALYFWLLFAVLAYLKQRYTLKQIAKC